MATAAERTEVRRNTNEPTTANYSDADLDALIDAQGVRGATHEIWVEKAAKYADLPDIKEGSSSRSMSQLHEHALKMARLFADDATATGRVKIHEIERPTA